MKHFGSLLEGLHDVSLMSLLQAEGIRNYRVLSSKFHHSARNILKRQPGFLKMSYAVFDRLLKCKALNNAQNSCPYPERLRGIQSQNIIFPKCLCPETIN